jgi:hypothetical protein
MNRKKTIKYSDDRQYGVAFNGIHVGNGYDVIIKRESDRVALVNIHTPGWSEDWLQETELDEVGHVSEEARDDMQVLAREIGQGPQFWAQGAYSPDDDGWEELAERWDAIEVKH